MSTDYDWTTVLPEPVDAEAPPKAEKRPAGAGKKSMVLPAALEARLKYEGEGVWFSQGGIPSATDANALIYKVRQVVKANGNGLSIRVDSGAENVNDLLKVAQAEKAGKPAEPVALRFHVKETARQSKSD